ncbi:MAG TPA: aminotransferase class I/II-fold pyridoxal phosphate-dependent enzyme [Polyangia bacterium]|jgi:dTDP-4-amino-4,6-dideoxygalactose transaminase
MAKLAIRGGAPVRKAPWPQWPVYDDREIAALTEVVRSRNWGGYPEPNHRAAKFAKLFAAAHGAKHGICAMNGSVTLEIALKAAGVGWGDEVIVPAFTWVATAAAAAHVGAVPVFVDVDPETYCIDPRRVEEAVGPRTRAIIPVHLGSCVADLDALLDLARRKNLVIIEDCAHAHGSTWNGKKVGSHGLCGSFSLQTSKLLTAGEGGVITTSDDGVMERCHSLVNCGRKEAGYDTFEGSLLGHNYRLTEFQAALLLVQLGRLDEQWQIRQRNMGRLTTRLAEIPGLRPLRCDPRQAPFGAYQYVFRYDAAAFDGVPRDLFCRALFAEGLPCDGPFYVTLTRGGLMPLRSREYPQLRDRYGEEVTPEQCPCPVADRAGFEEAVWLHHALFLGADKDVDDMADAIHKVRDNLAELQGLDHGTPGQRLRS